MPKVAEVGSEYVTQLPASALRAFIESYVGYRQVGLPAGIHRGLPSRHLTFIVSIGAPIDVVAQVDAAQAPARYGSVVGGLQSG